MKFKELSKSSTSGVESKISSNWKKINILDVLNSLM